MIGNLILILVLILIILVALNNAYLFSDISFYSTEAKQGNCSETVYGCCPDGVNSKIDFAGSNCPRYNPGPGYRSY